MKTDEENDPKDDEIKESMKRIFEKYEDVFKRLRDSDSPTRQHKEGAD